MRPGEFAKCIRCPCTWYMFPHLIDAGHRPSQAYTERYWHEQQTTNDPITLCQSQDPTPPFSTSPPAQGHPSRTSTTDYLTPTATPYK